MTNSFYYDQLVSWLTEKYGKRRGFFLANRLARAVRRTGDLCIDNIRVARIGDEAEEKFYRQCVDRGCCGSSDRRVVFKSDDAPDEEYMIGFNYGH